MKDYFGLFADDEALSVVEVAHLEFVFLGDYLFLVLLGVVSN